MTAASVIRAPSATSRVYGLGSVFGKGLRDSRWGIIGFGVGIGMIMVLTASQIVAEFPDAASRAALAAQMQLLPDVMRGLLGEPINIETLGGFIAWRTLGIMPVIVGIWSLMALSGTIGREAATGSLEFVLASPQSRMAIALQKLGAHLAGLAIAMTVLGLLTWAATLAFATLPGDSRSSTLGAYHVTQNSMAGGGSRQTVMGTWDDETSTGRGLFIVASVTKLATALAVLRLADAGAADTVKRPVG